MDHVIPLILHGCFKLTLDGICRDAIARRRRLTLLPLLVVPTPTSKLRRGQLAAMMRTLVI